MRNIWRLQTDPRRCDYVATSDSDSTSPEEDSDSAGHTDAGAASDDDSSDDTTSVYTASGVPLITTAIVPTPLNELSRRAPFDAAKAGGVFQGGWSEHMCTLKHP